MNNLNMKSNIKAIGKYHVGQLISCPKYNMPPGIVYLIEPYIIEDVIITYKLHVIMYNLEKYHFFLNKDKYLVIEQDVIKIEATAFEQ
jgi:hypothetical protein